MAPTYILRVAPARLYFAGVRVEDLRRTPVPELQRLYVDECRDLPGGGLTALKADPRAGARAIAEKIERRNHKAQAEGRRLWRLCAFELPLWEQGITLVAGCDEVGMAPLAGPVIAAAVILPPGTRIKGVNDSKLLTPEERDALEPEIRACALAVGIGRAEVEEIDTVNIYRAGCSRSSAPCSPSSPSRNTCSSMPASSTGFPCRSNPSSRGTPRASPSAPPASSPRCTAIA